MTKQLNELSGNTLKRYISKAVGDASYHRAQGDKESRRAEEDYVKGKKMSQVEKGRDKAQKHTNKYYNRRHGVDAALRRLTKEEYLDEGKMKELGSDLKDMDNGNFKKKYGKDKGYFDSLKPVKEEQLDELSKETRDSYKDEALLSLHSAVKSGDAKTEKKRMEGLRKYLRKEEVEQIDEISDKTVGRYDAAARKDIKKIRSDMASGGDKEKLGRKLANRSNGLDKAHWHSRMVKNKKYYEEVEHREEKLTLGSILEELRKRGRPKKKRDMQGNIIDDDDQN